LTDRTQGKLIAVLTGLICITHVIGTAYSSGMTEPVVQGDARSYFAYLPSIVLDGDLDLTNQFDVLRPEGGDPRYPFGVGANGYAANVFPVGPALLWLPGYLIGTGLDRIAAMMGLDTGPVGYGRMAGWGAAIAAILWAGLGFELCRRLARDFFGHRHALAVTVAVWLGTPALYYTLIAPLYSHAVAMFACALTLRMSWLAFQEPMSCRRWCAAGAAGGLLVAIRLQDAPVLLIPVGLLLLPTGRLPQRLKAAASLTAGGIAGYLPQAYTWYALHGELVPGQGLGEPRPFSFSRLVTVLFSSGYEGWLSWTPLALVALVGLLLVGRGSFPPAERSVAISAFVAILALVFVDTIHPYGQGAAFGARRYVSATPLLIIGVGGALAWAASRPRAEKTVGRLVAALVIAELWLFVAYELLVLRHGVYGSLTTTWKYAVGMWAG
jgi:hypothetical protein